MKLGLAREAIEQLRFIQDQEVLRSAQPLIKLLQPRMSRIQQHQNEINEAAQRQQLEADIAAQQQAGVPAAFQRPVMDMPAPERQAQSGGGDFWGGFSELMDSNPEQAWQFLAQAPQSALQSKLLVQDS